MKTKQVIVKTNKSIITEEGDEMMFRLGNFHSTSLGDYQEKKCRYEIRQSFYDDIAKKYELPRELVGKSFKNNNIEIIRSLVVFGDHISLIEEIKAKNEGTF